MKHKKLFFFLNLSMLCDEASNLRVFNSNVYSWPAAISANARTETDYTNLNSIADNSAATVTVARISSLFNESAEHSWSDCSPESQTLLIADDWLRDLHEIFWQWTIVNTSPSSDDDVVSLWANAAASCSAWWRKRYWSHIWETFKWRLSLLRLKVLLKDILCNFFSWMCLRWLE